MWTIAISQLAAALSIILFSITLTHRDMDPFFKAIGYSSLTIAVFLGSHFIFLPEMNPIIIVFITMTWHSACVLLLTQKELINKNPSLLLAVAPLAVMLFLKSKPYQAVSFFNHPIVVTAMILPILILFFMTIVKRRERILILYQAILTTIVIISGLNLMPLFYPVTLFSLVLAQSLMVLYLLDNQKHYLYNIIDETTRFKENFDDEVEKEVRKRTFYMEMSKEKMAQLNRTDHLTKALTRKAVVADIEMMVLKGNVKKFSMFVFDIDKFKNINDTLGHVTGDVCLKNVVTLAHSSLRDGDFIGRYGGDEFIIVLKEAGYKEAMQIGERFRKLVETSTDPKFTLSLGMSCYPWDGETYKTLFEVADKGLYKAKENGRNQIGYSGYIKVQADEVSNESNA